MTQFNKLLDNLNSEQKKLLNTDGPNLIVAGAGSGKTSSYNQTCLYNCEEAWPNQILCVTFTNKAAREMQIEFYIS